MKDIIVWLVNSKGGWKEYNVSTEVHSSDDTSEARPGWWTDVEENNGGNESKLRGSLVYILTAECGPGHQKPSTGFMPVNMTE